MNHQLLIITDKVRRQIAGAVAEIDLAQMDLVRRMTPAERVRRAAELIDATERVGAYRLRQRRPELSEQDALRIIRGGLLDYQKRQKTWHRTGTAS